MKKSLFLLLMISTLLAACNADQQAIIDYVNEDINPIGDIEEEAVNSFISVTGQNYTDDQTFLEVMTNEVIPKYEQFVEELEAIDPSFDELRDIHQTYVEGANLQLQSFHMAVEGGQQLDNGIIEESNKVREQGYERIQEYQKKMRDITEEYNVVYEAPENN